jgi:hypothetical protein
MRFTFSPDANREGCNVQALDGLSYSSFLDAKMHVGSDYGFDPVWMPDSLFPFQVSLVEWACRKGRAAIFADCGLGKTPMQLTWAENVARKTDGRVLILTPLAVAFQTVNEGAKFGIEVTHRRDGLHDGDRIVVTNYERLHHFKPDDFAGVVCDESSILKNFDGKTRKAITDFMRKRPYRLLCTATAAPNDYVELGTSAEALGVMERKHMLAQFFTHDGGDTSTWRIKGHAREHLFWRWVCSWARACRKPSDLGFNDGAFALPAMSVRDHIVSALKPLDGYLFDLPAIGLDEQRNDLRRTIDERCGMAADLCNAHDDPSVCWTNLNAEADAITKATRGAVNVQGADSDDAKEEAFAAFANGQIRVIVSKPSIAGFGLNWQHCAHMTFFPSHSYEQYYQCVRRCWRFGQRRAVTVDMVTTYGQQNVLRNMERKADAASRMFEQLVALMREELHITKTTGYTKNEEVPSWLCATK